MKPPDFTIEVNCWFGVLKIASAPLPLNQHSSSNWINHGTVGRKYRFRSDRSEKLMPCIRLPAPILHLSISYLQTTRNPIPVQEPIHDIDCLALHTNQSIWGWEILSGTLAPKVLTIYSIESLRFPGHRSAVSTGVSRSRAKKSIRIGICLIQPRLLIVT